MYTEQRDGIAWVTDKDGNRINSGIISITLTEYNRLKEMEFAYNNGFIYVTSFGFDKKHYYSLKKDKVIKQLCELLNKKQKRIDALSGIK